MFYNIFARKQIFPLVLIIFLVAGCQQSADLISVDPLFNGQKAFEAVEYQVSLGPRIPGSTSHNQCVTWITDLVSSYGWEVEHQNINYQGKEITNLIAKRDEGGDYLLIGAHYDSRIYADQDPNKSFQTHPVLGANDGASGVAVLIELARVLPEDLNVPVRLVFFDAEDNGGISGWDWIMGSRAFVENYSPLPSLTIIVDMVGDKELNIHYEYNSDQVLMEQIWNQAMDLGFQDIFIKEYKHSVLDDHTPFVEQGLPAVDIIDFDYIYWHTTSDTLDKVSPESLEAVGRTLQSWILSLE